MFNAYLNYDINAINNRFKFRARCSERVPRLCWTLSCTAVTQPTITACQRQLTSVLFQQSQDPSTVVSTAMTLNFQALSLLSYSLDYPEHKQRMVMKTVHIPARKWWAPSKRWMKLSYLKTLLIWFRIHKYILKTLKTFIATVCHYNIIQYNVICLQSIQNNFFYL